MMLIRLILILIISCTFEHFAFAENQTLDEINADLKAKKAELEPFDQSKVKVDVESLGLDDVDKKEEKKFTETKSPPPAPSEQEAPEALPSKVKDAVDSERKIEEVKKLDEIKVEQSAISSVPASDTKKPSDQYVNAQKKKNMKRRLEMERQKKVNAKKQKDKIEKFKKLRDLYLLDSNEGDAEEKITPRKKNLNPFANEEMPALPILNRYRNGDNNHIPIILTPREKVDLLFRAISINNVSFFNDSYRGVENPNAQNAFGDTILTYAMLMRRYSIVASIIAKGADVNMINKLGYTPVNIAIELLDFKLLEMLVNNKADLNYLDAFGRSYLMHAARVGFLPAADLFLSNGIDVNLMDKDGFTALAIAYRHKKEVLVQYLLKHGAKTWIEKPYDPKNQSLIQELENRWK
jgi:ankyrin repeat protein